MTCFLIVYGYQIAQLNSKCATLDKSGSVASKADVSLDLINDLKWGSMKVESQPFKDCRIWPHHAEEWDWNKTGTRHCPGIQIADFISTVDVIVLSEGVDGVLQIKPDTLEYLKKTNKRVFIARTPQAVAKYNDLLLKGERVGALIHTTC